MPLQRRIPKSGFRSHNALVRQEVRLSDLNKVSDDIVTLGSLKADGIIRGVTQFVKIILAGTIERALTLQGLPVTKGAREAIETAGGKVEA